MGKVALDIIRLDGETQPRAKIDTDVVDDYAALYEAGKKLPAVVAFNDGASVWLADGFHRYHGRKKANKPDIEVDERQGTVEDARWYAYAANQTHGMRRTKADKEKAIKAALKHTRAAEQSDNSLAEYLGVSDKTVAKYRAELGSTSEIRSSVSRRTGKDGKKRPAAQPRPPKAPVTAEDVAKSVATIGKGGGDGKDADDHPPKSGKQKVDPRQFSRLESAVGACVRQIDAVHRLMPHANIHRQMLKLMDDALHAIKEWQKALR